MGLLVLPFLLATVNSDPRPEDVHLHFHLGKQGFEGDVKTVGGDFPTKEFGTNYADSEYGIYNDEPEPEKYKISKQERKQEGEECGVLNNHGECDEGLICRQDPHPNTPATPGVCKTKACICPSRLQPVCGENWKVYGNACEARCEGIKVNCEGNCPCKGKMEEAGDTEKPENSKVYSLPNCTDTKHITANNIKKGLSDQNLCMHPWGGWSYPLGGYGNCGNPAKPCDLCACKPGNPPQLMIDPDGCEKGSLCQKPCPSSKDDHRVGDTWDCWHDDKRCMAQCSCTGGSNGGTVLRIRFGTTCQNHIPTTTCYL